MIGGTRSTTKKGHAGCLMIFGVPFVGVAVFMAWQMIETLLTWQAMQAWQETPAQILFVELESHDGEDSTTYQCAARYTYAYGGERYTGTRVAIDGGADNIGSFQQDAFNELARHRDSGQAFRCYVNPRAPSESVLYRQVRWEKLLFHAGFVVAFGCAGFGQIFGGLWWIRRSRATEQIRATHGDAPWLWKPEWAAGAIRSQSALQAILLVAFAAFWNAIALPTSYFITSDAFLGKGESLALLVLIFPAAGLFLALWAAHAVLRWSKYGNSVFRMAEVPGVIGGKLSGIVEVPVKVRAQDGFHITLSCVNRLSTGSGDSESTREHVRWQDSRTMARELLEHDPRASHIPVAFGIPFTCSETNERDTDSQIVWRLEVKAVTPGVDYVAQFDVPVFKTEASRPDFVLDEAPLAPYLGERDPISDLRVLGVHVAPLASGGVRIDVPAARNRGIAIGTTAFLLAWSAGLVALLVLGAPIVFAIGVGLIEALLIWHALDLWLGATYIEATPGALEFTGGWLGRRRHTLRLDEIAAIQTVEDVRVGDTTYYSVQVATTGGKKCMLAKRIGDLQPAQTLVDLVTNALAQSKG